MTEMWVNMGPQHPFNHGLWKLRAKLDGEYVTDADPVIGYLHRGWEKECESRKYPQIIPMADRLCYCSSMSWSHLYTLAVEDLFGVELPTRAAWIRTLTDEINRVASHFMWLAAIGTDLGNFTIFLYGLRERELAMDLFVRLCGQRMTTNFPRIGGIRNELPPNFLDHCVRFANHVERRMDTDFDPLTIDSKIFQDRMIGVGKISKEEAINMGATGPNLRGSGVDWDVRKNDPYVMYEELDFEAATHDSCDAWGRWQVRVEEIRTSCDLIRQCCERMPKDGPIRVKVPRRAPEGVGCSRIEDPRGESICYLVGDGTDQPYRCKIRSPNFVNTSLAKRLCVGYKIADIPAIMGTIDICIGETDR